MNSRGCCSSDNLSSKVTRDWWVILGSEGTKCNVLFLECQATFASGTIVDATMEEVEAAFGPEALKYKFTGDESRIMVKEYDGLPRPAPVDHEAVPLDRKWWVVEVRIEDGDSVILVQCGLTGAQGAVFEYTDEEMAMAQLPRTKGLRWEDDLRVQVIVEGDAHFCQPE